MKTKKQFFTLPVRMAFIATTVSFGISCSHTVSDDETQVDQKSASDSIAQGTDVGSVALGKDTVFTGQELFRRNCAGCHGLNREGTPPVFPSLLHIKDKMSKEQIREQIRNGKGIMISHAHLPDNEINAIIGYLFNESEQQTTIENYSSADIGKNLVMSNCVGCHRLTVNDPPPPNVKKLCPLIEPAALSGEAKPLTKEQFLLILKTGPCYMPSFSYLTISDKEAIWDYLKKL